MFIFKCFCSVLHHFLAEHRGSMTVTDMCCMRGMDLPGHMWGALVDPLSDPESYKGIVGLHLLLRVFRCVAA